jgi:uncharacterized protein YwqG
MMTSILNQELPAELLPYKENIERTIKSYIAINAKRENKLEIWQSRFGGVPYLPKSTPYPKDSKNMPMLLLAQINFTETPKLEPFPESGILQFYISNNDGPYGLNFDDQTNQSDFRVLYFPEILQNQNELVSDFKFLPKFSETPLSASYKLDFSLQHAPIPASDYQFEEKLFSTNHPSSDELEDKIFEHYEKSFLSMGHKIGGYPFFTQYDPRENEKYKNESFILLFQMDTDGDNDIMWGDAGVGNFFIREKDLQERNFSKILYNWDCC